MGTNTGAVPAEASAIDIASPWAGDGMEVIDMRFHNQIIHPTNVERVTPGIYSPAHNTTGKEITNARHL